MTIEMLSKYIASFYAEMTKTDSDESLFAAIPLVGHAALISNVSRVFP